MANLQKLKDFKRPNFVRPRENDSKIASIIKSNPNAPYKVLALNARRLGISDFELANYLKARKLERMHDPKSKELNEIARKLSDSEDIDLNLLLILKRSQIRNIELLRARIFSETGVSFKRNQLRKLMLEFQKFDSEHMLDVLQIPNLKEFYFNLPNLFLKKRVAIFQRIRTFTLFIEMLGGKMIGKKYLSQIRFVSANEFKKRLKLEFNISENEVVDLIQDFIDARIFKYVINNKYITIPSKISA